MSEVYGGELDHFFPGHQPPADPAEVAKLCRHLPERQTDKCTDVGDGTAGPADDCRGTKVRAFTEHEDVDAFLRSIGR